MDVDAAIRAALLGHPAVRAVRLVGSRAEGRAHAWSDWDFVVDTVDAHAVAAALPGLVAPLAPLAAQWDRLSEEAACFMLVLSGAVKVDLLLDRPPELASPWVVRADTLAGLDAHFWDWTLWLAGKQAGGRGPFVRSHLEGLMWEHLLRPLGVPAPPATLREAVDGYLRARGRRERELGVTVGRDLGDAVLARLRGAGLV